MKQNFILLAIFIFLGAGNANANWVTGNASVSPSSPIAACNSVTANGTFTWLAFTPFVNDSHLATLSYALPPGVVASSGTPSLLVDNVLFPNAIFTINSGGWTCDFPVGTIFAPGTTLTFKIAGLDIIDKPAFTNQQLTHSISFVAGPAGEVYTDNSSTIAFSSIPTPTVTTMASATSIALGQSVTLTGGGANTYSWDSAAVQNGVAFMPPVGTHVYTVTGTDANACTSTSSVSITVTNTVLSTVYSKFAVYKSDFTDIVDWATLSEKNSSHFEIERSQDGVNFSKLGRVNSQAINGNSAEVLSYRFIDKVPMVGHNYYRLQQVDLDGTKSVSEIIDVIWTNMHTAYTVYPNPANDILNIDLQTDAEKYIVVKLIDMNGRMIKSTQATSKNVLTHLSLSLTDVATGMYGVQIFENNKMSGMTKIQKK